MSSRPFNKVFCIGQNKTGTSSLHQAFLRLGLKSIHHGPPDAPSHREHMREAGRIAANMREYRKAGSPLLQDVGEYDAFSDIGPIINFFELVDAQYPNSRFIYTQRDTAKWVESRRKHVARNIRNIQAGKYESSFTAVDEDQWIRNKQAHFERVIRHFAQREGDLLIMDITKGDGYEVLCPFLGLPVPDEPFPRRNVAQRRKQ